MKKTLNLFIYMILLLTTSFLYASEIITNKDISLMVEMELDEDVIIAKINSTENDFNTTAIDLLELRKKGISKNIIKAMIKGGNENNSSIAGKGDMFYYKSPQGKKKMVAINSSMKVSNRKRWIPVPFVNKSREYFYFLSGLHSNLIVNGNSPQFITSINPTRLRLVKLGEHRKGDRYIVIQDGNTGREIQINAEPQNNGEFSIKPTEELEEGEYAFMISPKISGQQSLNFFFAMATSQRNGMLAYDFAIKK